MAQAIPTLGYQIQMASGQVEQKLKTKDDMKAFFNAFYLGTTPEGLPGFSLNNGLNFDLVHKVRKSPILSTQDLEYYATEYVRHGLKGPCR
jgi:soluble epoxide hydrolase/lipid-phosphate phosphatase